MSWLRDQFQDKPLVWTPSITLPEQREPAPPRAYVGLDLAKVSDWTALCVAERHGKPKEAIYMVRHLERVERGTSYPLIVRRVASLVREPAIAERCHLIVDATGVGAAVVDLLRAEKLPSGVLPVVITAGDQAHRENGIWYCPKRDLVASVAVLLQSGRLKIGASLPEAALLVRELEGFQVRYSPAGFDSYGVWREGEHDDLVLATALACWAGERNLGRPEFWCI